jgi:hypothetical protein
MAGRVVPFATSEQTVAVTSTLSMNHAGARPREVIERGGRSSGRLSGTATTTPIVGISPVAATPRPASLPCPLPIVPVMNLTAGVGMSRGRSGRHSGELRPSRRPQHMAWADMGNPGRPEDSTRTVGLAGSASRRDWARRVLGRRGVGPSGACPAHPASPASRGCRQRSTSARWRPPRSSPPCSRAGCRSG